jgi:hypothetical protein
MPKMNLILKNAKTEELKVYIEPSTDEILLRKNDTLTMRLKTEDVAPFEIHQCENSVVIWIPHGQSADFYVNGDEVITIYSQYIWSVKKELHVAVFPGLRAIMQS